MHLHAERLGGILYVLGDFPNGESLRELVKDSILAQLRRILDGQFHAADGVAQVYVTACLATLTVYGQRIPYVCLHAEAVDYRAENPVEVKARHQPLAGSGLIGSGSVDDPLHEVGAPDAPYLASVILCESWTFER